MLLKFFNKLNNLESNAILKSVRLKRGYIDRANVNIYCQLKEEHKMQNDSLTTLFNTVFGVNDYPTSSPSYPRFNKYIKDDATTVLEIAVAGFSKNQIAIEEIDGTLIVSASKEKTNRQYAHKGISEKPFEIKYKLDGYKVETVKLENGILEIICMKDKIQPKSKTFTID
jgi:HSP20 family molecular chaperone IbpA